MSKITAERMREILSAILRDDTVLDSYDCDAVTGTIVNHPEIKGLLECEEVEHCLYSDVYNKVDLDQYDSTLNKYRCPVCGEFSLCKDNVACGMGNCGAPLIWPTELLTDVSKTIEPPAPVAEYEIFEVQQTALETGDPVCEYIGDCAVGCMFCELHCKTNGKQNFAGHEVEGKSIRCKHKFNEGGEG
jgi:hypothetical protein